MIFPPSHQILRHKERNIDLSNVFRNRNDACGAVSSSLTAGTDSSSFRFRFACRTGAFGALSVDDEAGVWRVDLLCI
jgi:hypothetical protein